MLLPASVPAEPTSFTQLPQTNLLLYVAKNGQVLPIRTLGQWARRRAQILQGMQAVMGPLPGKQKRCSLDTKIVSEQDRGAFVERFITYASEPGSRVPAWLLIPKRALALNQKCPGVLALHPTDMEYGQRVVIEPVRPYYRAYGLDLVERGFVVIAPAYPLMANYQPDVQSLGYQSGTMKAIWDNIRALDLLETLPFIRKGRFAALGHSLGGHNAIFTAVFEPRIQAVVCSCGFDSFRAYMNGDITGWTSPRYMPGLLAFKACPAQAPFDFHELIGALAPRRVFISAPLHDTNFKAQSVDEIFQAALPVFRLYHAEQNLQLVHPDCAHDFPPEIREQAYDFLERALR